MSAVRVPLHGGELHALIDAIDAERVLAVSWHASRGGGKTRRERTYAKTTRRLGPGKRNQRCILLHRFVLAAKPGQIVDHLNGDTLDCRRTNLRITDAAGNAANVTSSKMQKRGGYKGVTWHKGGKKWEAACCSGALRPNGKRKRRYLGLFADPVAAAHAYDREAVRVFGEFAALNFEEFRPAHCVDVGLRALQVTSLRGAFEGVARG